MHHFRVRLRPRGDPSWMTREDLVRWVGGEAASNAINKLRGGRTRGRLVDIVHDAEIASLHGSALVGSTWLYAVRFRQHGRGLAWLSRDEMEGVDETWLERLRVDDVYGRSPTEKPAFAGAMMTRARGAQTGAQAGAQAGAGGRGGAGAGMPGGRAAGAAGGGGEEGQPATGEVERPANGSADGNSVVGRARPFVRAAHPPAAGLSSLVSTPPSAGQSTSRTAGRGPRVPFQQHQGGCLPHAVLNLAAAHGPGAPDLTQFERTWLVAPLARPTEMVQWVREHVDQRALSVGSIKKALTSCRNGAPAPSNGRFLVTDLDAFHFDAADFTAGLFYPSDPTVSEHALPVGDERAQEALGLGRWAGFSKCFVPVRLGTPGKRRRGPVGRRRGGRKRKKHAHRQQPTGVVAPDSSAQAQPAHA